MTSKLRWILLAALVVVHLISILVFVSLSSLDLFQRFSLLSLFFFVVCFGLLAGQICLLALWGAVGAGDLTRRLPVSLLLFALLWYSFVGATQAVNGLSSIEDVAIFLALFTAIYISTQSPLWLGRNIFNWRIETIETSPVSDTKKSLQFSIRTLMLWTAVISMLLALGRFILPWNKAPFRMTSPGLAEAFVMAAIVAGVICIIALPSLAVLFIIKDRRHTILFLGLYYTFCLAFGPWILVVISSVWAGGWSYSWEDSLRLFTGVDSFIIAVLIMIWSHFGILHALGFRFKFGNEEPTDSPSPFAETAPVGESVS